MKSLIVLSLSLFFILPATLAQQSKRAVQINTQLRYQIQNGYRINASGPSPSMVWIKPNNRRYQLEWRDVSFSQSSDSIRNNVFFNNSFRFEGARFHYSQREKLHFWLGGSVLWYQRLNYSVPFVSDQFLRREVATGFTFDLVPMMLWNLSERLYLDVGLPIELTRINMRYLEERNPINPLGTSFFEMDQQFLQGFYLRVGLGMWL